MRKANIQQGDNVLIVGAGGSIGSYAIQLAKLFGAEVTGIDNSQKQDLIRSLGADYVIDYTQEDFTQKPETYDVIFDVIGKSNMPVVWRVSMQADVTCWQIRVLCTCCGANLAL